ncbi:pyrroline-5-carboxylate reductase [Desulfonatronovibrio hydrogenovorans]|uniref:pyrroline-5-carboxylate reductase n=1 Tax=Desulfonatronovibrio hydrogenovorans TaxID=53245 RepID=UPI00048AF36A|nr:pyrroline-5-carboxylate reductase [Desulfonatronovibrio hydrogenovorans]
MSVRIGFIGAGNMGGAMIAGLARDKDLRLFGFDPDAEKLTRLQEQYDLRPLETPLSVAEGCDYIFLAVKPGLTKEVTTRISPALSSKKCLVSIAAGISVQSIVSWSEDVCPVARIMPNTPALAGRGVFAVCLDHEKIQPEHRQLLVRIISSLGKTFILPEKKFDAFTGLIGSGPAYVYYFMESMVEAGVLLGLDRTSATVMVKELFAGSAEMSISSELHITQLKEMVTSPGGTTAAGLSRLEKKAVKASIMEAVKKAASRSNELGKE